MPREIVILACTECKSRNYTTTKNKRNITGRLEKKKYCPFERKVTLHREVRYNLPLATAVRMIDSRRRLAQLVEQRSPKPQVAGSIPVSPATSVLKTAFPWTAARAAMQGQ